MNMFIIKTAVPPEVGRIRLDPVRALWIWAMAVPGLVLGLPALSPRLLALALALTLVTLCLGHSVGLHRGIIHRSYECGPLLRGFLAWLFVMTGLGGPLSWARLHATRDYWQNRADCPRYFAYGHGLGLDFIWNLHCRFLAADRRAESRLPDDVLGDPWLRFLEASWPLHQVALAWILAIVVGPGAVAVCVCARTAASILGHWFVGYAAHTWGERTYVVPDVKESGTNLRVLGVLSFGEGFHNNHHAFPRSARMGFGRWQVDLGWAAVWGMRRIGLVRSVLTPEAPEAAARIHQ